MTKLQSPKKLLAENSDVRISPLTIIESVDSGHVRIMGRRPWLTDPSSRKRSQWEGSPWLRGFDDLIGAMAIRDESLPPQSRRVIIAPPESGYDKASQLLADDKNLKATIAHILATERLPMGTLRKAQYKKATAGENAAVQLILRDAINHADATTLAGARAPYLHPQEGAFIGLMEMAVDSDLKREMTVVDKRTEIDSSTIGVIDAALRITKTLEPLDRKNHLERFLESKGHKELVAFVRQIMDGFSQHAGELLVETLDFQIQAGVSSPEVFAGDALDKFIAVAGLALSAVGLIDGMSALALGGLVTSAFPVGKGLLRKVGVVRPEYRGPLWPFLWHNGSNPQQAEISSVLQRLQEIRAQILAR